MIPTGADGTLATHGPGDPPESWAPGVPRAWWWALGAAAAVLALAYAPNLLELGRVWGNDENYQHGFLVVPIAAFILWRRLDERPLEPGTGLGTSPWWGWMLLVAALIVRAVAYERNLQWVETATLLPAIVGLVWAFGGLPILQRAWPAILFLAFMLPLPTSVNGWIALPLQRIAATGSRFFLQLCGFWVVQQGNVLQLTTPFGNRSLDVALACSGLKMLMTLAATVTATIMLIPLPIWKRIVLLISAVPIALISNISRIVATGWCYYYIKGEEGQHWAHDISGWMMMPLALVLVGLELQILAWLTPEPTEEEADDQKVFMALISEKKKPGKPGGTRTDLKDEVDDRQVFIPGISVKKKSGGLPQGIGD
jgi:exosortase